MAAKLSHYLTFILIIGGLLVAVPSFAFNMVPPGDIPCFVDPTQDKCRQPVLIVPGLGASYNKKLMLKDQAGGTWRFAPTVDWFDSLIERLEDEGYEQGKNLFVVYYDWRQSNYYSAIQYLIPAINAAKQASGNDKVDIIAHSMGGLVARAYAQSDNLYQDDIDQLIFLGTPNGGASGAYLAWEGGIFPETWTIGSKLWMKRIAKHLKKAHNLKDLDPPLLFRTFFPSLKELLPIDDYIIRDGNPVAVGDLTAQNNFLQELDQTKDRLSDRGIAIYTIAGNNVPTLDNITLDQSRDPEDIPLQRWRDGRANPNPPPANSTVGDQTVLASSVQKISAVSSLIMDGVKHEELPGQAQDQIASLLLPNPQVDFIPSTLAQAAVGIDILSPAIPIVTGPNGEILSPDTNTFSNADYDWDQQDPTDTTKVLTIADPPPGNYTITVTGLETNQSFQAQANNEYTLLITYADQNDTNEFEHTQTTTPGQVDTYHFSIGITEDGDSKFVAPQQEDIDIIDLLKQIKTKAKQTKKQCHLRGYHRANITRPTNHAIHNFKSYQHRLEKDKDRRQSARKRLKAFYKNLDDIERGIDRIKDASNCQDLIQDMFHLLQQIRSHAPKL